MTTCSTLHVGPALVGTGTDGDQGVADQLARAVEGHVAPPVDLHQLGAHGGWVDQDMSGVPLRPKGVDGGVLQQEQTRLSGP